jgi:hypothetical protein
VATNCLIIDHECLAAHLHKLSIHPFPICVLYSHKNSIMNKDHLKNALFYILRIILWHVDLLLSN